MSLITATEVSTIAFVNALDPALILPMFISSAETKYIVPLVTQPIIDNIIATPSDYTTLVEDYIKPYLAFSVKYMFYNQLLTETDTFPTSDLQRTAAIQEVLAIMEVSRALLSEYLNANIFTTTSVVPIKNISGFLINTGYATAAYPGTSTSSSTDVTSVLNAASLGLIENIDYLFFIDSVTGFLQKISFTTFKELILAAGGITTLTGIKTTGLDAGVAGQISITDDYGYFCTFSGSAGIAIWKKFILFQT